jgi:hypothetical protein
MKTLMALSWVTLIAVPTVIQSAAAAPRRHDVFHQSDQALGGPYYSGVDLTQSGPIQRGPLYRGYPLSDWYI